MDLYGYIDRVENAIDDPATLEAIREEVGRDDSLSAEDRDRIDERIGTYLADHERAQGPMDLEGPDTEDA